jgi:hypothetical protein
VISPTVYSWIYKYIQKLNYTFDTYHDMGGRKIETGKTVVLQNTIVANKLEQIKNKFSSFVLDLREVGKICNLEIRWYKPNYLDRSSLMVIPFEHYNSLNNTIFEVNNSNSISDSNRTKNLQLVDMKNTTARFINITLLPTTDNRIGPISEIIIDGKKDVNDDGCKKIPIKIIRFSNNDLYFNTLDDYNLISSYQKLLYDMKSVSKYQTEKDDVNTFTKLLSPMDYATRSLQLKANYKIIQ